MIGQVLVHPRQVMLLHLHTRVSSPRVARICCDVTSPEVSKWDMRENHEPARLLFFRECVYIHHIFPLQALEDCHSPTAHSGGC
jgi:hypothetical protein